MGHRQQGMPGYVSELDSGPPRPGHVTDAPTPAPPPAAGQALRDARRRVTETPRRPVTDRVRMNIGYKQRSIIGG
jgi:hypothetical protein